jgi:Holliday junction resolvase-like predicted endonuclease
VFSKLTFRTAERLIRKYQRQNKLELRELEVDYKVFTAFIALHLHRDSNPTQGEQATAVQRLQQISKSNLQIWVDMKAMMLEWIAYFVYSNQESVTKVKWNLDKNNGEIDVLAESTDRVKLIECKLKPANLNLQAECKKLKKKAVHKERAYKKSVDLEFWFWYSPNEQHEKVLTENNITFIVLSDQAHNELFKNIPLGKIRAMMQKELLQ